MEHQFSGFTTTEGFHTGDHRDYLLNPFQQLAVAIRNACGLELVREDLIDYNVVQFTIWRNTFQGRYHLKCFTASIDKLTFVNMPEYYLINEFEERASLITEEILSEVDWSTFYD